MNFIYYDTETTGTRPDKDCIIEIAGYDPVRKQSFSQLINPGIPIPAEITGITSITDEMVAGAPSFQEVALQFVQFCGEQATLIAHNNDTFDRPFLENSYKQASVQLPAWRYIDSLKWSRKYRSDLPRHSLQYLRETFGVPANQAHRALDDVMVLYQIFSTMIGDLPLETVFELLYKTDQVPRMPFGMHRGKPLSQVPKEYVKWMRDSGAFDKPQNRELKDHFEKLLQN